MRLWEDALEMTHHPGVFVLGHGEKLEGERAVRPMVVLPDEAVGLQPSGEGRLGQLALADLTLTGVDASMPLELVTWPEIAGRDERATSVPCRSPHEVVGCH